MPQRTLFPTAQQRALRGCRPARVQASMAGTEMSLDDEYCATLLPPDLGLGSPGDRHRRRPAAPAPSAPAAASGAAASGHDGRDSPSAAAADGLAGTGSVSGSTQDSPEESATAVAVLADEGGDGAGGATGWTAAAGDAATGPAGQQASTDSLAKVTAPRVGVCCYHLRRRSGDPPLSALCPHRARFLLI